MIPNDFKLVASYTRGGSPLINESGEHSWRLTVSFDGKAIQKRNDLEDYYKAPTKSFSLSQNDLQEILTSIKDSDFFSLPQSNKDINCFVFGASALVLKIAMDGRSHRVIFENDCNAWENDQIKKLWLVWHTVLKIIPSLNNNIELEMIKTP